jgi:hypothetical protein
MLAHTLTAEVQLPPQRQSASQPHASPSRTHGNHLRQQGALIDVPSPNRRMACQPVAASVVHAVTIAQHPASTFRLGPGCLCGAEPMRSSHTHDSAAPRPAEQALQHLVSMPTSALQEAAIHQCHSEGPSGDRAHISRSTWRQDRLQPSLFLSPWNHSGGGSGHAIKETQSADSSPPCVHATIGMTQFSQAVDTCQRLANSAAAGVPDAGGSALPRQAPLEGNGGSVWREDMRCTASLPCSKDTLLRPDVRQESSPFERLMSEPDPARPCPALRTAVCAEVACVTPALLQAGSSHCSSPVSSGQRPGGPPVGSVLATSRCANASDLRRTSAGHHPEARDACACTHTGLQLFPSTRFCPPMHPGPAPPSISSRRHRHRRLTPTPTGLKCPATSGVHQEKESPFMVAAEAWRPPPPKRAKHRSDTSEQTQSGVHHLCGTPLELYMVLSVLCPQMEPHVRPSHFTFVLTGVVCML